MTVSPLFQLRPSFQRYLCNFLTQPIKQNSFGVGYVENNVHSNHFKECVHLKTSEGKLKQYNVFRDA